MLSQGSFYLSDDEISSLSYHVTHCGYPNCILKLLHVFNYIKIVDAFQITEIYRALNKCHMFNQITTQLAVAQLGQPVKTLQCYSIVDNFYV